VTGRERLERAIHEAGHAVAALALGIPVHGVTIRSDRDSHGCTRIADEGSLEARAIVRLAGPIALAMHGLPASGCGRDLREARALAAELDTDTDRLLDELRTRTCALLFDRDRSRELGAVTLALLERDTLTGTELASALLLAATPRRGVGGWLRRPRGR